MGIFNFINKKKEKEQITEEIKSFRNKGLYSVNIKDLISSKGEGWEELIDLPGYGVEGIQSFNMFYNSYINRVFENERERMVEYRNMAITTEISDVIEDAVNESTQDNDNDEFVHIRIKDKKLEDNENILKNLNKEFYELFYEKIDMKQKIWDLLRTYYIDGRVYYERVINEKKPNQGIVNIKRLPSETMDFYYNPISGRIEGYIQYLKKNAKRPATIQEAKNKGKNNDFIFFDPNQIGYVDYGIHGNTRHEVLGYLEKARIPYNQLKLLETSVIIMRVVRAPERYVFKIDTGNMPRDKALKYVEKIKEKMKKKQTYDPKTGKLTHEPEIMSILENFYLPQSAEGRGSDIDTIGGNTAQFSELDDVFYFQRKLYRALKYPGSRVSAIQENNQGDLMFGGNQTSEISRDEIKWAKFLERQQKRLCSDLLDMFLLHLEYKGIKKQYGLTHKSISIELNTPSRYDEQMEQQFNDSRFNNYMQLADRPEFSKYYLQKRFLKWSDDDIQSNVDGMKKDKELGLAEEEGGGFGGSRF